MRIHIDQVIVPCCRGINRPDCQQLKDDIARNGLKQPIVVFGNRLVDGLLRLTACRELGHTEITL